MKAKEEKTNAIRLLEQKKIPFQVHSYLGTTAISGVEVASVLHEDPRHVFKTLVTIGKSNQHYVFIVPVAEELDLKKAASVVKEKNISMIKSKELLPLTGYIHGGCSPIGMKKLFKTVIHFTAKEYSTIFISAGMIGLQVELSLEDLKKVVPILEADIIDDKEN